MISLIVAASQNDVIGTAGELPWRLSADLRRFKALTMGKPVVMGRKTRDSIGRPLPGRQNIVISRQPDYAAEGCEVVRSADEALTAAGTAPELMVIGGEQIYRLFLPRADRIYLTRVAVTLEGDAHFPALDERAWRVSARAVHPADAANDYDCTFVTLERLRDA